MISPALTQTTTGKAYEYACVQAIVALVGERRRVQVRHNSSLTVASGAWASIGDELRAIMGKSAKAGVESLLQLEPKILEDGDDDLELCLQEDARGREGDVRDVLIIRRSIAWEIGISVKHNHSAVKHSRLSLSIDFGKEWLGLENSQAYFDEITPIFTRLKSLKEQGKLWNEVEQKDETVYVPVLRAFMRELARLDSENPGVVPGRLLQYLIGRKDFYKMISNDTGRFTTLQCFNFNGTLNTPSGNQQPTLKVKGAELPTKIRFLDYKDVPNGQSKTTIELVLNNNWVITFRIHNASSNVETSLKFDIQLSGVPSAMFSNSVSW